MNEKSANVDEIVIIGGPNGAGKTTAAQLLVPHGLGIREFVNADEIARPAVLGWPANFVASVSSARDVAAIYDNSDAQRTLIAERLQERSLVVHDANRWAMIERARP
jgi:predicted ABC-type ATPase